MKQKNQHIVRNSIYAVISALVICFIFYRWIDLAVASYFYHQPDPLLTEISVVYFKTIFSPKNWLVLSVLALLFGWLAHLARYKTASFNLILFGLAGVVSFFIAGVIKVFLARFRPDLYFEMQQYGFHFLSPKNAYNSMPSGHATASMTGFFALAIIVKKSWLTVLLLLFVAMICLSRLIAVEHYCSDVIAGCYIGVLSVYWTKAFLERKKKRA